MDELRAWAATCRWIGRIIGTFLIVTIAMIAIGEGVPNPFHQPLLIELGFLALALNVGGMIAGWFFELAGGIISLLGFIMFLATVANPSKGLNWFVVALALPGVLYLASVFLRRRTCSKKQQV